jgi:Tol biopolymer transport system component
VSPDQRFVAFQSAQSGRNEIYVRALSVGPASTSEQWQVSRSGALSTIAWRQDGRELLYLAADRGVMAVEVTTTPTFTMGTPRLLFYAPASILALGRAGVAGLLNASGDGQRFVFIVPPAPVERQLIILDRHGATLVTAARPSTWGQPALSPDGRHAAVVRTDPRTGNQDIWTVDLVTGKSAALTNDAAPDSAPIWSPDGRFVAYVSTRGDYSNIYRKIGDRPRSEELVYQNEPGAGGLVLTDWSADGRFLSFYSGDVLSVLPLAGDRKPIEVVRSEFSETAGRFSPDGRRLAYLSDESGRFEVYVRTLDASLTGRSGAQEHVWQVSRDGAQGMIFWRQDGQELGYLATDGTVMSAMSGPSTFTTPTPIFRPPNLGGGGPYGAVGNAAQMKNVSSDGRRFLVAVPTGEWPAPR